MSNKLKNKILKIVKNDLADIEKELARNLNPYLDLISKTANHILFSGGKRLRPLLMLLCARICGYNGNRGVTFSTIFEYIHTATLLHDDLVDSASMRRGKPVANSVYGNSIAILVGDFLLARALSIAYETGKLQVIKIIAEITENMSQGEIDQLEKSGCLNLEEKDYMEVIRRKTAVLFQGACRIGAIIADASQEQETAMADYGLNLGITFQIADDILDYTSETETLGKEIGADLKEGKITLPIIYSLKQANSKDRLIMENIIKSKDFSNNDFDVLIKLLNKHGGLEYAKKQAVCYVAKAEKAILTFAPSKNREILLNIADYALVRKA